MYIIYIIYWPGKYRYCHMAAGHIYLAHHLVNWYAWMTFVQTAAAAATAAAVSDYKKQFIQLKEEV